MIKEKRKNHQWTKGSLWLSNTQSGGHLILYCFHDIKEKFIEQLIIKFNGKTVKVEKVRFE